MSQDPWPPPPRVWVGQMCVTDVFVDFWMESDPGPDTSKRRSRLYVAASTTEAAVEAWMGRNVHATNLQTLAKVLRVVDTPGASPAVALAASAEIDRLHLALHVEQNRVQRLRQALSEARRALAAAEEV